MKIPEALWREVRVRSLAGMRPREIALWLRTVHGVECSHMTVRRLLERFQAAPPAAPVVDFSALPAPLAPGADETLQHWRRRVHIEAQAAEATLRDPETADWRRYHSALRLIVLFESALDRKRALAAELAELGALREELTPEQAEAALEAVRRGLVDTYGLVDPSALSDPDPDPKPN